MNITDELMNNLGKIIGSNQDGENVYKIFTTCKELFDKKEAIFVIDPEKIYLLQGVFFKREETGILTVIIGQKYIDTYRKDSSIHHTILIHELKHLYDCYMLKEKFYNSKIKEKHWFEFQARFIEIEFIKNYLIGKFTLTRLEDLLLKCYERDDFNYYTVLVHHISYNIFKQFKKMENEYSKNIISVDDIVKEIINDSYQLISEYLEINEEFIKYAYYVLIFSFRNSLEDIILKREGEPAILFDLIRDKYYYHLEGLYQKMYEIIDGDKEATDKYKRQLDYALEFNYTEPITQPKKN